MSSAPAKARSRKSELLSISKIAMRCGLDRATCRKRLDKAGFQPESVKDKEKLYRFDAEIEAALTEENYKLTEAKTRKETAAAQLAELKVQQQTGELVAVAEVEDYLQRLFSALHKEVCVRFPGRIAASAAKATNTADTKALISRGLDAIFATVAEDHGQLKLTKRNGNGR